MDALHLQAETLVGSGFKLSFDEAAGTNDSIPGQHMAVFAKHLRHLAMIPGVACGFGNFAIGGYFAFRDAQDG